MNLKPFFVDALSSALDLGIATPDDVLRHVSPDLLAQHLPRPLWARLLTACVGASRVDAQLVIETIGISNLCEHIPTAVIWSCIADLSQRSLGGETTARPAAPAAPAIVTRPPKPNAPLSISGPPPPDKAKPLPAAPPLMAGPSIPAPSPSSSEPGSDVEEDRPGTSHPRTTGSRFRPTSTNIGRLASTSARRPQAAAPTPPPPPPAIDAAPERPTRTLVARRGETQAEVEVDVDVEVEAGNGDWRSSLAVEDEQLVDWSASDETVTGEDPDARTKR